MQPVSIRELRNHGAQVIDRVKAGERLMVTRDGEAVAQLVPLGRSPLSRTALLAKWSRLPPMSPERLRADLDALMDPGL